MAAVKNNPFALQLVSPSLREDPLVVDAAVSRNGSVILSLPTLYPVLALLLYVGLPHPESIYLSIYLSIYMETRVPTNTTRTQVCSQICRGEHARTS
jgi:hypothetical protein